MIGAGITGLAVCKFLSRLELKVLLVDEGAVAERLSGSLPESVTLAENFSLDKIAEFDTFHFAVPSPGVDLNGPLMGELKSREVIILSEFDLAIACLGMPRVAVTGTNGKTTTVNIIHEMFLAAGEDSRLVGNVGRPFIEEAAEINPIELRSILRAVPASVDRAGDFSQNFSVAEMSSYQLDCLVEFSPNVAVFLNIEDDHLERHRDFDSYFAAKKRIFSSDDSENWSLICLNTQCFEDVLMAAGEKRLLFGVA
ncbi:hypothetical protein BVY02_02320, partial [bacterium J17]